MKVINTYIIQGYNRDLKLKPGDEFIFIYTYEPLYEVEHNGNTYWFWRGQIATEKLAKKMLNYEIEGSDLDHADRVKSATLK